MSDVTGKKTLAKDLPADPAGRKAAVRAIIRSQDLRGIQPQLLDTVSAVETGNYSSRPFMQTNSLFNRHKGSGRGEWTGQTFYANPQDMDLRIYDSLEQSVRDIVDLLHDPLYTEALAYAQTGQAERFFQALANGDGKQGYVGDPKSGRAANYVASLTRTYNSGLA